MFQVSNMLSHYSINESFGLSYSTFGSGLEEADWTI
jgi:hypothetical protein